MKAFYKILVVNLLLFRVIAKFTKISDSANITDQVANPFLLISSRPFMRNLVAIAMWKLSTNQPNQRMIKGLIPLIKGLESIIFVAVLRTL